MFLPERASWLADFEAELFAFPGSRNDDQCDSRAAGSSVRAERQISAEYLARDRRPSEGVETKEPKLIYVDSGRGHSW